MKFVSYVCVINIFTFFSMMNARILLKFSSFSFGGEAQQFIRSKWTVTSMNLTSLNDRTFQTNSSVAEFIHKSLLPLSNIILAKICSNIPLVPELHVPFCLSDNIAKKSNRFSSIGPSIRGVIMIFKEKCQFLRYMIRHFFHYRKGGIKLVTSKTTMITGPLFRKL